MLEAFISSRIRRTLFEYLLTHPTDQFYLRGLAKSLGLSVSPLRRELARLERSGMLAAVQEGNIRFYRVNTESPAFRQLQHVGQIVPDRETVGEPPAPAIAVGVLSAPPPPPAPIAPTPHQDSRRSPLRGPALVGAAIVGMALMLILASLVYLTMTNDRLASVARRVLTTRAAEVTVVAPSSSVTSGLMRGQRWQVLPGGFGGFSSGASDESY